MSEAGIEATRLVTLNGFNVFSKTCDSYGVKIPVGHRQAYENLKRNQFLLAIVGEVNAGKSTFINALLGKDLLPTDALQATSAIIEIQTGKEPMLEVEYANGRKEQEIFNGNDENEIERLKIKLTQLSAINQTDRVLPVSQLDDFLIDTFDEEKKMSVWEDDILQMFIDDDFENIHNIAKEDFSQKVRAYLEKNKSGENIAKKILVTDPQLTKVSHFKVVDTPGIGAKGGFERRTIDFMTKADSVIYLHKGEPSQRFLHDAWENVITDRTKEHMLLVLTHKYSRDTATNERFLEETRKTFTQVKPERIFLVDSLTELVLTQLYPCGGDWQQINEVRRSREAWKRITANAFEDADMNAAKFLDLLEEQSGMRNLRKVIDEMAEKSQSKQIAGVANNMLKKYKEWESLEKNNYNNYNTMISDPQRFAQDIVKQEQIIEEMKREMSIRVSRIRDEHNCNLGGSGIFSTELEDIRNQVESEMNGKQFDGQSDRSVVDDYVMKMNEEISNKLSDIGSKILEHLKGSVDDVLTGISVEHDMLVPQICVDWMLENACESAFDHRTVERQFSIPQHIFRFITLQWRKVYRTEVVFNAGKYYNSIRSDLLITLENQYKGFADRINGIVERTVEDFQSDFRSKLDLQTAELRKLKHDQRNNEELRKEADEIQKKLSNLQSAIHECQKIILEIEI